MRHPRSRAIPATADPRLWFALPAATVLKELEGSPDGLSAHEAQGRGEIYGANRIAVASPVSPWKILAGQVRSLIVGLLGATALVALLLGDLPEAVAVFAVLVINVGLGFWTEWGSRRAMDGLRRMQVVRATVLRDGGEQEIDAAEVVPGDILVLGEGSAVSADARVTLGRELRVVEAPLTGEPFPVDKDEAPVAQEAPLAERTSMVYKGTVVVAGNGRAVVTATGAATEVGRIGELLRDTADDGSPLERRLDRLARRLIGLTLALAALVTGVGLLRGGNLWLMVETGLALAVAAVPEGLPVVATITLAVGMSRMARRRALVRRLPAVEALGSTTVICTDKTGTLTAGEMTVTTLYTAGHLVEVSGEGYRPEGNFRLDGAPGEAAEVPGLEPMLIAATLANRAALRLEDGQVVPLGDPTEAALLVAAGKAGFDRAELVLREPELGEVPFSSERRLMATFHRGSDGTTVAYVKGGPGPILERCSQVLAADGSRALVEAERGELLEVNRQLAARGLRVLALARGRVAAGEELGVNALKDLVFLGYAGLSDPPAAGVEDSVRRLREAGVRTVMITGDQAVTAAAISRQLGLLGAGEEVLGGLELQKLDDLQLQARIDRVSTFSRISPADKLRLVAAFQQRGEIVGMLGDGVNDAPALKQADIGVAMGGRGTDVAKETADMVLLDDQFGILLAAVEEGRVIFDNIRKFVFYLFSCNLSEVMLLFAAVFAGLPLPLLPLQILWLNLVTDVFPALALAVEPAEDDVLRRPPRRPEAAILSRGFLLQVALHGAMLTGAALGVFFWASEVRELELAHARTLALMTTAFAQLFHVFTARSPRVVIFRRRLWSNPWIWAAVGLVTALQLLICYLPAAQGLFDTRSLSAAELGWVIGVSLLPLLVSQAVKAGLEARRRVVPNV